MNKHKIVHIICGIVIVGFIVAIILLNRNFKKKTEELYYQWDTQVLELQSNISNLQNTIDSMKSDLAEGYQLKNDVKPGQLFGISDLELVPITKVLGTTITKIDPDELVGKMRYKTKYSKGTLLTTDMLIEQPKQAERTWIRDVVPTYLQKGIKEGSWVQIRFVTPGGAEFPVIDKIQVKDVKEDVVRFETSIMEDTLFRSLETDYAAFGQYGVWWYIALYNEPMLTDMHVSMYPIREEMYDFVELNRDILDKSRLINKEIRKRIMGEIREAADKDTDEENPLILSKQAGDIVNGRNSYSTSIGAVYQIDLEEQNAVTEDNTNEDDSGLLD